MGNLNETPMANRLHIGIFGKRNSGKSSLINALTGQDAALVSDKAGTTTDPVSKAMEVNPIGPVVFIDTAGFDDEGELGKLRIKRTKGVISKCDIAIVLLSQKDYDAGDMILEEAYAKALLEAGSEVILAVNMKNVGDSIVKWGGDVNTHKSSVTVAKKGLDDAREDDSKLKTIDSLSPIWMNINEELGIDKLREKLVEISTNRHEENLIFADMIKEGDLVLLVMPQDKQAPKGRLILPQVQSIRELLDRGCRIHIATDKNFQNALESLAVLPDLIVTDSQCFKAIYEMAPKEVRLTSFSVLFAGYKGDIKEFIKGAYALRNIKENSKILIAEACSHVPLNEDIGREKIPNLLRKKYGEKLKIVNINGNDFPEQRELENFDLIIHCGACMFNKAHVMARIKKAEESGVPITNYGIILAELTGILDKIAIPNPDLSDKVAIQKN